MEHDEHLDMKYPHTTKNIETLQVPYLVLPTT